MRNFYKGILGIGILLVGENLLQAMEKEEKPIVFSLYQACGNTIAQDLRGFSTLEPNLGFLFQKAQKGQPILSFLGEFYGVECPPPSSSKLEGFLKECYRKLSQNKSSSQEASSKKKETFSIGYKLFKLAGMYFQGKGVLKDKEKGLKLLLRAANQGHAKAQSDLAVLYFQGKIVPKNEKKGVEFLRQAAAQGHAGAQYNLALIYHHGRGVPKDMTKAIELYEKAASQGYAEALSNLGFMYLGGIGVQKNERKAAEFFSQAAEKGCFKAQYNLAWMYEKGQGINQDKDNALRLYKTVATQEEDKETARRAKNALMRLFLSSKQG